MRPQHADEAARQMGKREGVKTPKATAASRPRDETGGLEFRSVGRSFGVILVTACDGPSSIEAHRSLLCCWLAPETATHSPPGVHLPQARWCRCHTQVCCPGARLAQGAGGARIRADAARFCLARLPASCHRRHHHAAGLLVLTTGVLRRSWGQSGLGDFQHLLCAAGQSNERHAPV
eukprot:COSAG01_NODE_12_length_41732_cov_160.472964_13_plen_177_part_00